MTRKQKKPISNLRKRNPKLFEFLDRATDDIKKYVNVGKQIPYKQIPKSFYKRFPKIKGMPIFKYDLPKAWRIIYAVGADNIKILAILLEICDHKRYDEIFKYHMS